MKTGTSNPKEELTELDRLLSPRGRLLVGALVVMTALGLSACSSHGTSQPSATGNSGNTGGLTACTRLISTSEAAALTGTATMQIQKHPDSYGATSEPVKRFETRSYDAFCTSSSTGRGSLIHAMVGSFGGCGRRWQNRAGFAA